MSDCTAMKSETGRSMCLSSELQFNYFSLNKNSNFATNSSLLSLASTMIETNKNCQFQFAVRIEAINKLKIFLIFYAKVSILWSLLLIIGIEFQRKSDTSLQATLFNWVCRYTSTINLLNNTSSSVWIINSFLLWHWNPVKK